MILYHGTNASFEAIDLSRSRPNKDFGRGFYLSADKEQALEMAKVKVEQFESGTPTVMASSNVDLPLPFSPMKYVTEVLKVNLSRCLITGMLNESSSSSCGL